MYPEQRCSTDTYIFEFLFSSHLISLSTMSISSNPLEEKFLDAAVFWDLERLYADLATIKQKPLSSTERICLRGLLCGLDPNEIAASLHRQPQGLRVDLTRGIYRYVAAIAENQIKNWRDIAVLLERAGYRCLEQSSEPDATESGVAVSSDVTAYQDLGDAPDVPVFFGRTQELTQLKQWITGDSLNETNQRCRLVSILGMGGIGKTNLSLKLLQDTQHQFEFVIWRSLLNAPLLVDVLTDLIQFFTQQQETITVDDANAGISKLLYYLRTHRCLLVLDNVETVLQGKGFAGQYRAGYEEYGVLLQQLGAVPHQSCLLLTSREKPREIARLEGRSRPVRSLELKGLEIAESKKLFAEFGNFSAAAVDWQKLVDFYQGNPLALELVAKHIQDVFSGNIASFLQHEILLCQDLQELLDWHFERLSEAEQEVMYWLAIEREPVAIADLKENILSSITATQIPLTLQSLQRRFPLEKQEDCFSLQPIVMDYITERLVEQVCAELVSNQGVATFLQRYALLKATAKDYIRESQIRVIVQPVLARLTAKLNTKAALGIQLQHILRSLRNDHPEQQGYAGGNIINLLHQLDVDLTSYDFSGLTIRQAYLANANLHSVNFERSALLKSVFAETFGCILCVAFSGDGQYLATSDTSGNVQIWNLVTGNQHVTFKADTVWTWAVAFSPDSKLLASVGDDCAVKLWQVSTGTCLQILEGHTHTLNAIAFSPDGQTLASCGQDTTIRLWNLNKLNSTTKACVGILQGHTERVWSVTFSPDSQTLVSGSEDGTLKLWDTATGMCYKTLSHHDHWVKTVAISPDGKSIASASFDGIIKIWDTFTGECLQTWQAHQSTVTALVFRPVSSAEAHYRSELASCSYDQTIKLWDVPTGQCIKTWQAHSNHIWSLAFRHDGKRLASGGDDHTTRLWDTKTGRCTKTWKGYTKGILALALDSQRGYLATGHEDQTLKLWSSTGERLKILHGHRSRIWSVALSPSYTLAQVDSLSSKEQDPQDPTLPTPDLGNGYAKRSCDRTLIASGSADRTIKLWDSQTGQCLSTLKGHAGWVWSVAFHPQHPWLASASYDHTVRLWNIHTGECLSSLIGHTAPVVGLAFSPDGQWLASSSFDTTIKIWQLATGKCVTTLRGHQKSVWAIAFSPDGQQLASCSYDKTLKLWDTNWNSHHGQCLQTLRGHTGSVTCLAFSPSGQMLASGGFDRTIKLWHSSTGQLIRTFSGHTEPISALLFQRSFPSPPSSCSATQEAQNESLPPSYSTLHSSGFETKCRAVEQSKADLIDYSKHLNEPGIILSSSFDATVQVWDVNTTHALRTLKVPSPYDGMNITNTTGLSNAQKTTLYALGAFEVSATKTI